MLNPWQWADEHLELSARFTAYPGRFRSILTPYIRDVLEAFQDPEIRVITLCWSAQSAKTTTLMVMVGYIIDQAPGPALTVQPSMDGVRSFSKNRLIPLIEDCPRLERHKTGKRFDLNSTEMILDRLTIYLQGAGSPSQLASRPIKYLFADEVDKWPESTSKEADALSLAIERTKSYRNKKIVLASTPTVETGAIWQAFFAGNQCQYHVPCPICGAHFVLEWKQIKWPEATDYEIIKQNTWLECPHCKSRIEEKHKPKMLEAGQWMASNPTAPRDHKSYHLSELYSPWSRWGDLAIKFLRAQAEAKTGNKGALHNFINSSLAEPWEDQTEGVKQPDEIISLCDDREPGQVPDAKILALTAGIDTQDNGFWFVIWAWGPELTGYLIREGFAADFEILKAIVLGSRYTDPTGKSYIINMAMIDSQGHRTAQVYDFCRANPKIRPIKGERQLYGQPYKVTMIDKITRPDGKTYPIPGGLQLYRLNTTFYKDMLASKLSLSPDQAGAIHLHKNISGDFVSHMTAEYKDEKGFWIQPKHKRCDLWDASVYALAAADILGVKNWIEPGTQKQPRKKKTPGINPYTGGVQLFGRNVNPWKDQPRSKPSWFLDR